MNYQASRLSAVVPAASVVVSQQARELKAQGKDIIDLGIGEPDFDTPGHIIDAAHAAAVAGETRYTPMSGTARLKAAVAEKLHRDNGLAYEPEEIIISNGAKQIIFNAMMATLEHDDEVLLCAPFFGSYKDIVLSLGGQPKAIECSAANGFRLTAAQLENAITPQTRWLFLNLPSNPAGAVYTLEQLQELTAVIARHPRLLILSDEIYEHIIFDQRQFVSTAAAGPEIRERILTVNGVSKAYAMTGWRIGYGAGPKGLIDAMTKVQSQVSSAPSAVSQAAAAVALTESQQCVEEFRQAFQSRRDLVVSHVDEIDRLTLDPPGGAFYAYIGCADCLGLHTPDVELIKDDVALTQYLLQDAGVAAVPGSAYGLSPFFRISTATSAALLTDAMQRIAVSLSRLE